MKRATTYSAYAAAVGAFVVAMTFSLISGAFPPGGGTGNPIITGEFTFSLDSQDTEPITGDIASEQPFYVHINDIIDWDGIGDPDPGYDTIVTVKWYRQTCLLHEQFPPDDPEDPKANWTWVCTVQPTLPHEDDPQYPNGNNAYRGTYYETNAEVLNGSCKVRYRAFIHDGATITDDDHVYATSGEKRVLDVDYVIVVPNPGSVAVGGQIGLTGKAYNMGGDDERHFDDSGNVIGGTADNDVQIGATFVWCAWGPNIGAVSPLEGTSTVFTAAMTAGQCFVRARFDGPGADDIYGDAQVIVTSPAGYWIDLKGINYEDVQNVPINGWAPAALDGTGDVGQTKAKVVITGEPDTEYDVTIGAPSDVRLNGAVGGVDFSLTTDGEGSAEQEFEIHAEPLSPTPSETLEDLTLYASMFPLGETTACAVTQEKFTLYEFYFHASVDDDTKDYESDEHTWSATGNPDVVKCWHEESGLGDDSSCGRLRKYSLGVFTQPHGAWHGSVNAKLHMRLEEADLEVCMSYQWRDPTELKVKVGVKFELGGGFVEVSREGVIPIAGNLARGLAAGDMAVVIDGQEKWVGDKYVDSQDLPNPPQWGDATEQLLIHFPAFGKIDYEREYSVGTTSDDLVAVIGGVSSDVEIAHFGDYPGTSGKGAVDINWCFLQWSIEDDSNYPGFVSFTEDDGVFEISGD